ncbi:hypothetical protein CPJCM30710_02070 [Clostridium polyendosporum]|uniref:Glycosyl hydrolase family 13 catalytic domain-containing protein n=1 Tax=Clostridium polyendosporum TaxID=69208 RepID=A0A919VFI6_9CLOT|nr:type I pullulanase [Clostridium polyendosporum]GIM27541.1 hypothetical protein CPJCM30710_02070 [Clostridium polyendosporum]
MVKMLSKEDYARLPIYEKSDLGVNYSKKNTIFKLWAPTADEVKLCLFDNGEKGEPFKVLECSKKEKGVWEVEVKEDIENLFYTYRVRFENIINEAVDPYAKAVGVNGMRGMVVDLSKTNIEGWEDDKRILPSYSTDAIIYEMHIRDMTISENSGVKNKGKFLGLTEENTTTPAGVKTAISHLKDLGVTHVHLMPVFDFATVDETRLDEPQYNWGYDPLNYNVPEGSYSTNPYDGTVRIKEFKKMIKAFHDNGIGVIMDVVYNHTALLKESWFNLIVPGYYYRQFDNENFSNGSGCGNETASERPMVRKYIIDSVVYWTKEYHIDGFRFDLMGVHDIKTMNEIRKALDEIDSRIIIYGEGWKGGPSALKDEESALKKNIFMMNSRIAVFSNDIRDGVKGDVFIDKMGGFVNGEENLEETIKFGVVASTRHPQIDYSKIIYSDMPWANEPIQTITYVSAHDNLTLWDKILATYKCECEDALIRMDKLSNAIVLTSQGISFLHSGEEFLRTKGGDHNSYKSPDNINMIDWSRKEKYYHVFEYYKGLIKLRKEHPAFRMHKAEDIRKHLEFLEIPQKNVVGFVIKENANGDSWRKIIVIYNANKTDIEMKLPESGWSVVVDSYNSGCKKLYDIDGSFVKINAISAMVLVK